MTKLNDAHIASTGVRLYLRTPRVAGCHIKKWNGKLVIHQEVNWQVIWNGTVLKFG